MYKSRARMSNFASAILFIVFFVLATNAHGASAGRRDHWGPRYQGGPRLSHGIKPRSRLGLDSVRRWNDIALDANAVDHARSVPDEPEQLGPVRTARAFAIVHIAIFDAVNAIAGGYRGYAGPRQVTEPTSIEAAVAQAAHDTLVALFPSQATGFDRLLAQDLSPIRNGHAKGNGIDLGRRAAAAILALRASDGSQHDEELYGTEYPPAVGADKWRQDPISEIPLALGSRWGELVARFVLTSATQFPIPPLPAAGSREFFAAFDEVKNFGGCVNDSAACAVGSDDFATPTMRNAGSSPNRHRLGLRWDAGTGNATTTV